MYIFQDVNRYINQGYIDRLKVILFLPPCRFMQLSGLVSIFISIIPWGFFLEFGTRDRRQNMDFNLLLPARYERAYTWFIMEIL